MSLTKWPDHRHEHLSAKQRTDFEAVLDSFTMWARHVGKHPQRGEGYADTTVQNRLYRLHEFFTFVFDEEDGYTTTFTHDHADTFMQQLAYSDRSNRDKSNYEKALKCFYKWLHHERGRDEWEPPMSFPTTDSDTVQRDFLSMTEREQIRDGALSYGSLPHYNSVTPEERHDINVYLSQRFGKPIEEVGPSDWERADGYKYPSLVFCSLDGGLRPIEVKRATVEWCDIENNCLRVPKSGSKKDEQPWRVGLTERTTRHLDAWLTERQHRSQYDDTDALWLTENGNRYRSRSLSHVLHRLFEEVGLETRGRQVSWYTIRRSTAVYLIDNGDVSTAKNQLRHHSIETTLRYDQAPSERVGEVLETI